VALLPHVLLEHVPRLERLLAVDARLQKKTRLVVIAALLYIHISKEGWH
jgi:hypothetical protein